MKNILRADDVKAQAPEEQPFSYYDGGRIHRLCLLPSIDELNVTSDELALTKHSHANPGAKVASHGISTTLDKKLEAKTT